jgi:hypothetical protein
MKSLQRSRRNEGLIIETECKAFLAPTGKRVVFPSGIRSVLSLTM